MQKGSSHNGGQTNANVQEATKEVSTSSSEASPKSDLSSQDRVATEKPLTEGKPVTYRSDSVYSPVREARSSYDPSSAARTERTWKTSGLPDATKLAAAIKSDASMPAFPELSLIGQHHGTYLIAQNDQGLYLIDQHAAHERVNYEYYYEKFGNPAQASQELLLPITLEFTPSETEKLKTRLAWFEQAGVYLEHFGGQTFRVRSHPFWFPKGDEKDIIEEMSEWVLSERSIDVAKMREAASIMCSCKASIKANQKLTDQEAEVLIQRLGSCRQPYTCPHGRPIVVSFSTYDLEKLFKRVM